MGGTCPVDSRPHRLVDAGRDECGCVPHHCHVPWSYLKLLPTEGITQVKPAHFHLPTAVTTSEDAPTIVSHYWPRNKTTIQGSNWRHGVECSEEQTTGQAK